LGPTLSHGERTKVEKVIMEYSDLFVTDYAKLPAIIVEQHYIDFIEGAMPMRSKQRMPSDRMAILKKEIDKLLEVGFIIWEVNLEWINPMMIVPKKGGK